MTMQGPRPEPEVVIRKIKAKGHEAHHGGAWKVAYADFVTAMMAFFLLMWLLGSTNEQKRQGIADYFAPPSVINTNSSGGGTGVLGGNSIQSDEGAQTHSARAVIELDPIKRLDNGAHVPADNRNEQLARIEENIRQQIDQTPELADLGKKLHFIDTPEGMRIELIDDANYSMFVNGTAAMDPRAAELLTVVGKAIRTVPNKLAIRGHTDAMPFASGRGYGNNWALSAARAESTRKILAQSGIADARFARLEGVADTDPFVAADPFDARNRRMSVTLLRE